jgi:hypothetical protein
MSRKLPLFTKLPSGWIEAHGLKKFKWNNEGSDNLAALMLLAVIAHHIDPDDGIALLTYTALGEMASLSRAKVSAGLDILERRSLVERGPSGRSSYGLANYNREAGWAKLPARGLYHDGVVYPFTEFRLRRRAELDAMKLYFLFVARRSRQTNMAKISYYNIEEYAGVRRPRIRPALTVLGANGLSLVERIPSELTEAGVANAYRLTHLDPYVHMGTAGRQDDFFREVSFDDL